MKHQIILTVILAAALSAACNRAPEVGVISSEEGLKAMLEDAGYKCSAISLDSALDSYDIVWYHRPDTAAVTEAELAAGPAFIRFMEKGGKLVLSMDAVKLGNAWGLEPNPVEVGSWEAEDYGFGRKVGYHSWRSHPLFDGMHGGAYPWHGHEDNVCRVLGYTGTNMPQRPGTRIVATLWQLIFYHPDYKVIWEQKVGRGSLLSIGCFLYYDRPNYNTKILRRFSANVVNWLSGGDTESPERYWTYEPAEVLTGSPVKAQAVKSKPGKWTLDDTADSLCFTPAEQEVTVPTPRCMTVCDERGGIKEIWTHPVMSLKDYRITAYSGGKALKLNNAGAATLKANSLHRSYSDGTLTVSEILTADVNSPAVLIHYEWNAPVDSLVLEFASNMRYMWPYDSDALGSLRCGWSEKAGIYSITACDGEFVSLVGANLPGKLLKEERHGNLLQVDAAVALDATGQSSCDVVFAAGSEGQTQAMKAFRTAMADPERVYTASAAHWQDYLARTVSIVSPDPVFNEGYRWATVSAGQFLAETPGIGSALMAGYSSSLRGWGGGHRVSGRPGYAWYFGRDSEIAGFAFLGMGDFAAVKSTLEVLSDFQGEDGTIFHELTTSGSDHFDASDATPLYVVLMAEYLRATGDLDFVKAHMPNVYKAMEFCFSTDTDGDHLIEIRHVGHGWLEGGDYFTDNTEFYLCGIWAKALEDGAWLAHMDGDPELAKQWFDESDEVKKALDGFWNPKGYYNYGLYSDGRYSESLLTLPTFPIWLGVTNIEKARATCEWYSRDNFSKPWGVRQTGDPRNEDGVGPYDECNIWPLLTGSVALAEYFTGLPEAGFRHLMANLNCYSGTTHGRVPEVLRGNAYRSGGITAFQCWSETGVTGPAIAGMLGWRPLAVEGGVILAPQIPAEWDSLSVRNLRIGDDTVGFDMHRTEAGTEYEFFSTGAPKQLLFLPQEGESRIITLEGNTKITIQ